jgi:hypothetical protein
MNNPLPETHVALRINIFDQTQHALVRKHLTIDRLITDILREFAQELDLNRKYILLYEGRQLDPELIIGQTQFDSDLVFGYYEPVKSVSATRSTAEFPTVNGPTISPTAAGPAVTTGVLHEVETGREFLLMKSPAVIGRASSGSSALSEGIDIDLSVFREGKTVSRPHGQITESGGKHYFEGLKEHRPVYLNDNLIAPNEKHELKPGDVIGVGKVKLRYSRR